MQQKTETQKRRYQQTATYKRNRQAVLAAAKASGAPCAICGKPLDFSGEFRYPHPLSVEVDHVQSIAFHGDSRIENLQAVHRCCNRFKGDGTVKRVIPKGDTQISNRILPHHADWSKFGR